MLLQAKQKCYEKSGVLLNLVNEQIDKYQKYCGKDDLQPGLSFLQTALATERVIPNKIKTK